MELVLNLLESFLDISLVERTVENGNFEMCKGSKYYDCV